MFCKDLRRRDCFLFARNKALSVEMLRVVWMKVGDGDDGGKTF